MKSELIIDMAAHITQPHRGTILRMTRWLIYEEQSILLQTTSDFPLKGPNHYNCITEAIPPMLHELEVYFVNNLTMGGQSEAPRTKDCVVHDNSTIYT